MASCHGEMMNHGRVHVVEETPNRRKPIMLRTVLFGNSGVSEETSVEATCCLRG